MTKHLIPLIILLMGSMHAGAQEDKQTLDDYIFSRTSDSNGQEIVGITVPGRPPGKHREPVAEPSRSSVILGNVPAFDWSFGCSATSAAMAAGYYDNQGYPDMYTGPTNGGLMPMDNSIWGTVVINGETRSQCPLSATRNGVDGRTTAGHVDDYWVLYNSSSPDPYITGGWTQHTYEDCTGDYMGTNQSALTNVDGATVFYMYNSGTPLYNYTGCEPGQIDGCHGLRDFYESRGYVVTQNYSQYIYGYNGNTLGFTFAQFKQEIDNGRPVILQLVGHSVLGYGYDDTGNTVYIHDTWDYNDHSMTWGGSYGGLQHYGVGVVELEPSTFFPTANFTASPLYTPTGNPVIFTDLSTGNPVTWSWSFSPATVTYLGGSTSSSQNPQVSFDVSGFYSIALTVTNANGNDTELKYDYIHAYTPGMWSGTISSDWNNYLNWDDGIVPSDTSTIIISPGALHWPQFTGLFTLGSDCATMTLPENAEMTIDGDFIIAPQGALTFNSTGVLHISGDWTNNGTFNPGSGTIDFFGASPSLINEPTLNLNHYQSETFQVGMTVLTDGIPGPAGNDKASDIPIGFAFNYAGSDYLTIRFCTNGWLALNLSGGISLNNPDLFTGTSPATTLAPWWDDLEDDNSGTLSYKTEGSSPNRIFTAEWSNIKTFSSGADARVSFQVKLYESSNVIEFLYGTLSAGTHNSSESASIGIEDITGGPGHFIEATTGSRISGVTDLVSSTNWPIVNYRFTPQSPVQTFHNVTISKTASDLEINSYTEITGSLEISPAASIRIKNGETLKIGTQ